MLREIISLFIIASVIVALVSGYQVHKLEQKECRKNAERLQKELAKV